MSRLIQSYADAQAASRPQARAVVLDNQQLTYAELQQWSNALARALHSHGCRRGDRVGLLLSKAPLAVASILGVLKADCICVPLDIDSPAERLIKILDSSEPSLLLVDASGRKIWNELRIRSKKIAAIRAAATDAAITLSDRYGFTFCVADFARSSGEPLACQN